MSSTAPAGRLAEPILKCSNPCSLSPDAEDVISVAVVPLLAACAPSSIQVSASAKTVFVEGHIRLPLSRPATGAVRLTGPSEPPAEALRKVTSLLGSGSQMVRFE
ncbi:MAG: hypothetical protein BWZ02_01660 [Lentisphaerae bacterium ADurb.BinA184]|nr:MAG: hypothetical protein BWZ02_01660 [Lentisphaerae bacterium ADurb.BinA184]